MKAILSHSATELKGNTGNIVAFCDRPSGEEGSYGGLHIELAAPALPAVPALAQDVAAGVLPMICHELEHGYYGCVAALPACEAQV